MIAGLTSAQLDTPWRTIWFSPRRTIRGILEAEVRPSWVPVVALAMLDAILQIANLAGTRLIGWRLWLLAVVVAVCAMVMSIGLGPPVLSWHGRWRGGVGTTRDIRQSMAWSYAPLAVTAACWIPLWVATGGASYDYGSDLHPVIRAVTLPLYVAADLVAPIWAVGLAAVMLAEVQRYSIWRALDGLVLVAFITALVVLFTGLVFLAAIRDDNGLRPPRSPSVTRSRGGSSHG